MSRSKSKLNIVNSDCVHAEEKTHTSEQSEAQASQGSLKPSSRIWGVGWGSTIFQKGLFNLPLNT